MQKINKELFNILKAFDDNEFLSDIILIGSWCLIFYEHLFEGFKPTIRTTDIDFYVPHTKNADPKESTKSLKSLNYDHIRDTLTSKSKFISPDGFEIEFITKLNRDNLSCVRLGKSGIFAEALSHVELYASNYIQCDYFGIKVNVASPAAFIIQKALINNKRGVKAEKDKEAIKYVASFVFLSHRDLEEFQSILNSLPKKWKKSIVSFFEDNGLVIPSIE